MDKNKPTVNSTEGLKDSASPDYIKFSNYPTLYIWNKAETKFNTNNKRVPKNAVYSTAVSFSKGLPKYI